MKKIRLYGLALLLSVSVFAQQYSREQIDHFIDSVKQIKDKDPDKVLPASFKCYEYARNIGYRRGMVQSLILSGKSLLTMGQYDAALEYAAKSEAIARKEHYHGLLCEVYRLKANCYKSLGVELQEHKMLKKAMELTEYIQDENMMYHKRGNVLSDMADYYIRMAQQDSAVICYENSDNALRKVKACCVKNIDRSLAASGMVTICLMREQYDLAEIYQKKAEDLAEATNSNEVKLKILWNKANYALANHKDDEAIDYYEKTVVLAKQLKKQELLRGVYYELSVLYEKTGDDEKAVQSFLESHKINEQLQKVKKSAMELPVKIAVKNTEQQFKTSGIGIIIALVLASGFIVFFLVRAAWYYRKTKQRKQEMDQKEQRLKRRKELLEKAKDIDAITLEKVVEQASENDPDFLVQFAVIYFEFYEKLLEVKPPLKAEELKIGAMRKLGFTVKEIAIITDATVRSVEARIYRIRKKISGGSAENTEQWFEEL